jgi:hypothetical protein
MENEKEQKIQTFSDLIDLFFQKLGLEDVEDKDAFIYLIGEIIQKIISIRILNELSDEDAGEFLDFVEKNKDAQDAPEKIYNFLKEKIPNLDNIILEEIEAFVKETQKFTSTIK